MATVVAFHAHPDDEVLLTGGTLAKLAAGGHRVMIVVACDGAMHAPNSRLDEFRASAAILGAARAAHRSPANGQSVVSRLFRMAVMLPGPAFALLAGREWFAEPAAAPGPVLDDIFASRSG